VLPDLIYFEINSAVIRPAGRQTLQALVNQLKLLPKATLLISGHADDTGSEAGNAALSAKRAAAVAHYLVKAGLNPKQFHTEAFGSRQPLTPNRSAAERALNRRVEIKVE
jgi:OOP family OmpA-OmpF porin